MSFVVLRAVSVGDFGAFSIAYSLYVLTVAVTRAVCGDPLVIRFSLASAADWRQAVSRATGAALWFGAVASALLAFALIFTEGALRGGLLALAVTMPGLLLQDVYRAAFFAAGEPKKALANDALWGVAQILAVVAVVVLTEPSVLTLVLAWGGAGVAAGLIGIAQAKVGPRPSRASLWVRDHSDLGPRFLAEVVLGRGTRQVVYMLIAGIAGLAALGGFMGARVLFGPLHVAYLGLAPFAVSEGARLLADDVTRFIRVFRLLGFIFAAIAVTLGGVLVLLPTDIGVRLTPSWLEVRTYIWPVAVIVGGRGLIVAWRSGLRAMAASRASLRAQSVASPLLLMGGLVGVAVGGGAGAAIGIAIAVGVGSLLWRAHFYREARQRLG